MSEYTKEELREFDILTSKASSHRQMDRIEARLHMKAFVSRHGEEKCNAMFEELKRLDAKRAARAALSVQKDKGQ